jgi:4-diphosphocytidyl-2-C-methyl-D-erythritol kinase
VSGRAVFIRAPAKVNLGLEVLRKRRDGYHEIRTLFQSVSLTDGIRLERTRRGIRLECPGVDGRKEENLAWRAAELFFRRTGAWGGMSITLAKGIPIGGGLGGGSSDAAAVLLGACRLFGLKPALQDLAGWAGELGSDVPFFLYGGAAVGTGRGERIETLRAKLPAGRVLIYAPTFPISTAGVYSAYRRRRLTGEDDRLTLLLKKRRQGSTARLGKALFNDLEKVVLARHPELAEAKRLLLESGAAGARVSGSGSCVFGVYSSAGRAVRAAGELRKVLPGKVAVARFLPPRLRWGVVKR